MFAAFAEPNFRAYMVGMVFSSIPMTMMQVAQGYLAFTMTNSAAAIGIVSLTWGIPGLIFTLFGGAIADRHERRVILAYTQAALAVINIAVAALIHLNLIEFWHLIAFALLHGTIFAFNMPARQGMLPDVLSEQRLLNGVALNNSMFSLLRIGGPSLAGTLMAMPLIGVAGVYDLMAVSNLIASVSLFFMKLDTKQHPASGRPMLGEIWSALRNVVQTPTLFTLMALTELAVVFGMPFQLLMPVFAVRVYDVGATGLGFMLAATGAGALIGSLLLAANSDMRHKALVMTAAILAFALSIVAFGLTGNYLLALVILMLNGGLSNTFIALASTLIMTQTDRALLGRTLSIQMLIFSLMPMASLPMSATADAIGAPLTVVFTGSALIVLTALILAFNPRFREVH